MGFCRPRFRLTPSRASAVVAGRLLLVMIPPLPDEDYDSGCQHAERTVNDVVPDATLHVAGYEKNKGGNGPTNETCSLSLCLHRHATPSWVPFEDDALTSAAAAMLQGCVHERKLTRLRKEYR